MKNVEDVLRELTARGTLQPEDEEAAVSLAEQARCMIAAYCRIPWQAALPERLFMAWVALCEHLLQGGENRVASLTEGDVSIGFEQVGTGGAIPDAVKVMLAGDRRLF